MLRVIYSVLMVIGVAMGSTAAVQAYEACNNCGKCESCFKVKLRRPCTKCKKPQMNCVCTPVQMVNKPVYETCYRKEQQVTQKQFVETHYRDELYTETVPVTKVDCITVDEGCYQQIWVPKLVTKQIPRTEYVHKTACRQVPYQVTKSVPEVSTKMVPYQRVRYIQCPSTCVAGVTLGTSPGPSAPSCSVPNSPSCSVPNTPSCAIPNGAAYGPQPYPTSTPSGSPGTIPSITPPPAPVESIPTPATPVPRSGAAESSSSYFPSGPAVTAPQSGYRQPAELGNQINPVGDAQQIQAPRASSVRPVPEAYLPRPTRSQSQYKPSASAAWNSSTGAVQK